MTEHQNQNQNKITVSYRFSRRLNLGNYESCEAEAFVSAQVGTDEDVDIQKLAEELTQHAQTIVYQGLQEEAEANNNVPVVLQRKLTGVKSNEEVVSVKNPQGTRSEEFCF